MNFDVGNLITADRYFNLEVCWGGERERERERAEGRQSETQRDVSE
jgi:hypothetical protein